MDAHIKTASLAELAEHLNYSRAYTSRLIGKLYGESFSELLQRKRCALAAHLLRETELPVGEIIRAAGYENGNFFRRRFRQIYGKNPLEYRHVMKQSSV